MESRNLKTDEHRNGPIESYSDGFFYLDVTSSLSAYEFSLLHL